ncbi:cytochrome P450 [Polychytrium aggregatum]|uniref:cytochrome P450 n=1 Tax=Polychytrium aggregatum TaxID=110093 RepID=UPI0022FF0171|nr:cytochrome P450 [Polychytrium aggregatum]KAI9203738.1 cytochrome P450 [Polychytrium aggregatum]
MSPFISRSSASRSWSGTPIPRQLQWVSLSSLFALAMSADPAVPFLIAIFNNGAPGQSVLVNIGGQASSPPAFPHEASAGGAVLGSENTVLAFHDLNSLLQKISIDFGLEYPRLTPHPVESTQLLLSSLPDQATTIRDLRSSKLWFASSAAARNRLPLPPGPPPKPFIGNTLDLLPIPVIAIYELVQKYGHFFPLSFGARNVLVVSDPYLIQDIMRQDDAFSKLTNNGALHYLKPITGNGLFTANDHDVEWGRAHRILLPAFSVRALSSSIPMMNEQTLLLVKAFKTRFQDTNTSFDVSDWMSKVTLDIVSLFGFSYKLDSISNAEEHPFVTNMVSLFESAMEKVKAGPLNGIVEQIDWVTGGHSKSKDDKAAQFIKQTVNDVIKLHQEHPEQYSDMCSRMLELEDPETGEKLTPENICYQIVTFMIAGHETTSGLLTWTLYMLATHPDVELKVRREVEAVFSKTNGTLDDKNVSELKYTLAVLKETLRLYPSAPAFAKTCIKDTFVGPYAVKKNTGILFHGIATHRNTSIWGPNPEQFNPDNFLPVNESKLPQYSYIPFGLGARACIGSQFALIEARIVLAHLVHNFKFSLAEDADPTMHVKLTLRPHGIRFRLSSPDPLPPAEPEPVPVAPKSANDTTSTSGQVATAPEKLTMSADVLFAAPRNDLLPVDKLLVLYGTNMGTSEDVARGLGDAANKLGFNTTVDTLDNYANGKLFDAKFIVVVTSTYNGHPPDNAKKFAQWISKQSGAPLSGSIYAVYGVGNKQWKTYQAFPGLVDNALSKLGAASLLPRGCGDVDGDFDGDMLQWTSHFWSRVAYNFKVSTTATGDVLETSAAPNSIEVTWLGPDTDAATPKPNPAASQSLKMHKYILKEKRMLTHPEALKAAWYLDLEIPSNEACQYQAGDHFAVFPVNPDCDINALIERLDLDGHSANEIIQLSNKYSVTKRDLQIFDIPVSLMNTLRAGVDIRASPSRSFIKFLSGCTECPPEKQALLKLCGTDAESMKAYAEEIMKNHVSIVQLIAKYKSLRIPLSQFLENIPLQKPRLYSIASSRLVSRDSLQLCVGVLREELTDARGNTVTYQGLGSTYLSQVEPGQVVLGHIRPHGSEFQLPGSPSVPIVMICSGTGIAPMRSFLQERQALQQQGAALGEAILIYGSRNPDLDELFGEELRGYLQSGALTHLESAYSRYGPTKQYVQSVIANNENVAQKLWSLIQNTQAKILLCGSTAMGNGVRASFVEMFAKVGGLEPQEAEDLMTRLVSEHRFVLDVWG